MTATCSRRGTALPVGAEAAPGGPRPAAPSPAMWDAGPPAKAPGHRPGWCLPCTIEGCGGPGTRQRPGRLLVRGLGPALAGLVQGAGSPAPTSFPLCVLPPPCPGALPSLPCCQGHRWARAQPCAHLTSSAGFLPPELGRSGRWAAENHEPRQQGGQDAAVRGPSSAIQAGPCSGDREGTGPCRGQGAARPQ